MNGESEASDWTRPLSLTGNAVAPAMKTIPFRTDIYLNNSIKVNFRKFRFHFYLLNVSSFYVQLLYIPSLPPSVCFPSYFPHFLLHWGNKQERAEQLTASPSSSSSQASWQQKMNEKKKAFKILKEALSQAQNHMPQWHDKRHAAGTRLSNPHDWLCVQARQCHFPLHKVCYRKQN